jgi:Ca2+-binding RTX toxin-like protein
MTASNTNGAARFAQIETLETRRLLAAPVVTVSSGTATVTGTDGDDNIAVSYVIQSQTVMLQFTLNDSQDTADPAVVNKIVINSGAGNDTISVLPSATDSQPVIPASVDAGIGNDVITTSNANDTIDAGAGDDTVFAGLGDDSVFGGDGNDKILGNDGHDTLSGGANKDTILGGLGNDRLNGNGGNDRLEGSGGLDTMLGQSGDDRFYASDSGGYDQCYGGTGNDTASTKDVTDIFGSVENGV